MSKRMGPKKAILAVCAALLLGAAGCVGVGVGVGVGGPQVILQFLPTDSYDTRTEETGIFREQKMIYKASWGPIKEPVVVGSYQIDVKKDGQSVTHYPNNVTDSPWVLEPTEQRETITLTGTIAGIVGPDPYTLMKRHGPGTYQLIMRVFVGEVVYQGDTRFHVDQDGMDFVE